MTLIEFIKENPISTVIALLLFFSLLFFPLLLVPLLLVGWWYEYRQSKVPNEVNLSQFPSLPNHYSSSNPIRGNRFMSSTKRNLYLASPAWQSLRQQVIARDKVCQLTGSSRNLEVHHITYDNLGAEYLDELVLLSRQAHQFVHDYYGSYDRTNTYPIEPLKNNPILLNIS